jgi:hypothetical protein
MNSEQLFGMALGLHTPWQVDAIEFKASGQGGEELHLSIGFARGSRFADAKGQACLVHDTVKRTWQHLNFFEHPCYLHCQVPRIKTSDGRVETVAVPWARPNSGFTLLFEALAMALIEREMPVKRVAEIMRVNPQRIWTVRCSTTGSAKRANGITHPPSPALVWTKPRAERGTTTSRWALTWMPGVSSMRFPARGRKPSWK